MIRPVAEEVAQGEDHIRDVDSTIGTGISRGQAGWLISIAIEIEQGEGHVRYVDPPIRI